MENKRRIFILMIFIILFSVMILIISDNLVFEKSEGSSTSGKSTSYKTEFKNGEMIAQISNFNNMSPEEKNSYVRNLTVSKGYTNIIEFEPKDGFQVWHAINSDFNPEKHMNVIIKQNTGEVVIFTDF